jgi:hypothetical protein
MEAKGPSWAISACGEKKCGIRFCQYEIWGLKLLMLVFWLVMMVSTCRSKQWFKPENHKELYQCLFLSLLYYLIQDSVHFTFFFPMALLTILESFPLYWGFLITYAVGLLWTSDQPAAEASTYTGLHNTTQETNMHASSRTRTRNPRNREAENLRIRPRGHRDLHLTI